MATSLKLHKLCTVLCKLIGGGLEIVVVSNVLFVDLLFFLENLPNVISSMKFHIGRRSPGRAVCKDFSDHSRLSKYGYYSLSMMYDIVPNLIRIQWRY